VREAKRYLGLELAGAKNQKTSLAALEFYPKEKKIFLLDIFDRIAAQENETGDEALLEVIQEVGEETAKMGVNVALELPPCIACTRKTCPLPNHCTVPSVKWMRETTRKSSRSASSHGARIKEFTPYTQRPIELWIRYQLMPKLPDAHRFEIDETLGGNRAPLSARMHFLKRQLANISLVEVSPKLSVAILAQRLSLHRRIVPTYRHLEDGVHSREEILTHLAKTFEIFIYERDMQKLAQNLTAFDAFICAFTALLSDQNLCTKNPKEFPISSGWIHHPLFENSP
jgi:hypothetical protein